jgi:hypothetical protein
LIDKSAIQLDATWSRLVHWAGAGVLIFVMGLLVCSASSIALVRASRTESTNPPLSHPEAPTTHLMAADTPDEDEPTTQTTGHAPTYEELCPGLPEPGAGAPEPFASAIYGLWLGYGTGDGAVAAGCAQQPEALPGHPDIWVARGQCGGALRSMAVTAEGRSPALLYQQAAALARHFLRANTLIGASPRVRIGDGDLYVIDTSFGSYVLVRRHQSGGEVHDADEAIVNCENFVDENYRYTLIPPGMLSIWHRLNRGGWTWPVSRPDDGSGIDLAFYRGKSIVAAGGCLNDLVCSASEDGAEVTSNEDFRWPSDVIRQGAPAPR